jgi:mono/diheme cytochrome c family protein
MVKLGRIALALAVIGLLGFGVVEWWRTRNVGAVQRGWTVAHEKGCFTCHGPGGLRGMANPGYGLDEVPSWAGGLVTMYAENEQELREWILDGIPQRIERDPEQMKLRQGMVVDMPPWRGLLSDRELDDLVAFVKAVSDLEKPEEDAAEAGRQLAQSYGCFNCHGPQGRGSMPNVRAFKGYIPAWDGRDFPELARDDAEIREWILEGGTRRLMGNPLARWFLERQPIKMPAYRGHIKDEEVDRLIDYIHWVRRHPY